MEDKREIPFAPKAVLVPLRRVAKSEAMSKNGRTPIPSSKKDGFMIRLLDGLVTASLAAIFFGLPLFFTGRTLQGIAFEKEMYFYFCLLIGAVSFVLRGVMIGEMRIRKTPLDMPIVLFLAAYAASAWTSVDRWHSFWGAFGDPSRGMANVMALTIAYYLIVSHVTPQRTRAFLTAFLASSFLMMAWSLLAVFGVRFLPKAWEAYAPFSLAGSVTALTVLSGGLLPVIVAVIVRVYGDRKRNAVVRRMLLCALSFGMIADGALLLVFSAYVLWLTVMSGFAFFMLYILAKAVRIEKRLAWLPTLAIIVLLTFAVIDPIDIARVAIPIEAAPSTGLSWEVAKKAIKQQPFFGSGPATYGYDFSLYRPREYNDQPQALNALRFQQGSGLYFEVLATLGLIGSLTLTLAILSFVSVGFYMLAQNQEENKMLSLGLWSMSISLLTASLLTTLSGPMMMIGAMVAALAVGVLMRESCSEESYNRLSLQLSPKFALALTFVFFVASAGVAFTFVFVGKMFRADTLAASALTLSSENADGANLMMQARQFMPYESRYAAYAGQLYTEAAVREAEKTQDMSNTERVRQYLETGRALAVSAHAMSPNDVAVQEMLAQREETALAITGPRRDSLEAIAREYARASELESHNPLYYVKIGQVKKALAHAAKENEQKTLFGEARDLFQQSVDEKKDFALGYFNLGLAQESLGDIDAAIASLAKSASVSPKSKDADDAKYQIARLLRIRDKGDDTKFAEAFLKELSLAAEDKDANVLVSLGLVYEQMHNKAAAVETYQKALALFGAETATELRKQMQQLIDNVESGKSNLFGNGRNP
jgi:tetratricopeptide (TPR) repeat protein/O-antigen ligase